MEGDFGPIDGFTLFVLLLASFCLGLYGVFGFDVADWVLGSYKAVSFWVAGASSIWQFFRQQW